MLKRIVWIDDEPVGKESLPTIPGFELSTEIYSHLANEVYTRDVDLFILDVHMPIVDGFMAADRIRELDRFKTTPILFLTYDYSESIVMRCLDFHNSDYFLKEGASSELMARIKYLLSDKGLQLGALIVDPASVTATLSGKSLDLTLKEFKILLALMNAKKPISKAVLTEFVWGELNVSDKTLNSHLTNLRSKLAGSSISLSITREGLVHMSNQ